MIIAGKFNGDNWLELQRAQHQVYGEALNILRYENEKSYKAATFILMVDEDPIYDSIFSLRHPIDHRTMQDAHDHMAAVWRKKNRYLQPDLFIEATVEDMAKDWLEWLRKEVSMWSRDCPWLVRMVCLIIVQQNVKRGYEAEEALQLELERLYPLADA